MDQEYPWTRITRDFPVFPWFPGIPLISRYFPVFPWFPGISRLFPVFPVISRLFPVFPGYFLYFPVISCISRYFLDFPVFPWFPGFPWFPVVLAPFTRDSFGFCEPKICTFCTFYSVKSSTFCSKGREHFPVYLQKNARMNHPLESPYPQFPVFPSFSAISVISGNFPSILLDWRNPEIAEKWWNP